MCQVVEKLPDAGKLLMLIVHNHSPPLTSSPTIPSCSLINLPLDRT